MRFLLRWTLRLAYLGLLVGVFGLASWLSFRHFLASRTIRVPELVGSEVEAARQLLVDRGLVLEVDDGLTDHDPKVPAGGIRMQLPAPRTAVKEGATIRVAVSLGAQILQVPQLAGMTSRAASLELERRELRAGRITTVVLPGRTGIVAQSPPAGTRVPPASAVDLLVAHDQGPARRILPDFVGRDLAEARAELERWGCRIGTVRTEPYEGIPADRILRQSPRAGFPVRTGAAISVVVSRGADVPGSAEPLRYTPPS